MGDLANYPAAFAEGQGTDLHSTRINYQVHQACRTGFFWHILVQPKSHMQYLTGFTKIDAFHIDPWYSSIMK